MSLSSNYPSTLPSLMLDFANTKKLDPRITFTRATTATYYDGKTTTKAEENLCTYSQDFSNASWAIVASFSSKVSTSVSDPSGGTTACEISYLAANGSLQKTSLNAVMTSGQQYTFSIWAKRASGTNTLRFATNTGTSLATFSPTSTWTRYSVTFTFDGTWQHLLLQDTSASGWTNVQYWGAQLEQRSSVTAYTATTSAPITNYIPTLQTAISGQPRFDHNPTTGESLGLLIEESRTNLALRSAEFDNASWTKTRSSITANANVSPDGTLSADQLIEDTTSNNSHYIIATNAITIANLTAYTFSFYSKAVGRNFIWVQGDAGSGFMGSPSGFDLTSGTLVGLGSGVTSGSITSVGNGWYRCSITATSSGTTAIPAIGLRSTSGTGLENFTGNGYSGIYIWGAQLEAGSFATSYIPTTSATVTRNADLASMTGTNLNSWFNNNEGTLSIEVNKIDSAIGFNCGFGYDANNYVGLMYQSTQPIFIQPTVSAFGTQSFSANTFYKVAAAYKNADSAVCLNTTLATNTTAFSPFGGNTSGGTLYFGTSPFAPAAIKTSYFKKLAYYPTRLTNAQLQALTS